MEPGNENSREAFSRQIKEKEKRKVRFQSQDKLSAWSGLGMVGIVGWSVVVPALLGTALGVWLDKNHPQSFSWTISLLFVGLAMGCIIAWNWIDKEKQEINKNIEDDE